MIEKLLLVGVGIFIAFIWRFVRERGHAVFGVKDRAVQEMMIGIISRYTTLLPLNMINSGPTHQQVFRGGTVVAYFDDVPEIARLPKNVRSYVVWGNHRRREAVEELVKELHDLGYEATVHEPLREFPLGTFLMVRSDAFLDNAQAFRPHWVKMVFLQIMATRAAKKSAKEIQAKYQT
jgi:hypothetical protein